MLSTLQIEGLIRERLLSTGVVEQLKGMNIFIWTIRATRKEDDSLQADFSVDITLNPGVDMEKVRALVQYVLQDLNIDIHLQELSIRDFCCYGQCHGCLNGDPETQPTWIGRKF